MNLKTYTAIGATLIAFGGITASAVDITIADPHKDRTFPAGSGAASGPSLPEKGAVEWQAIANETWDLHSFNLSGNQLSMTGSFNFDTGRGGAAVGGSTYLEPIGDIFIYTGQTPYTVSTENDASPNPLAVAQTPAYIIRFNRAPNSNSALRDLTVTGGNAVTYEIYSGASWLGTPDTASDLYSGLPWIYNTGGTLAASGTATYEASGTLYSAAFLNTISDINLAPLNLTGDVWFHTTMRCGNDVMWGKSTFVPDAGTTLALMGIGLGAIGFAARRRN